MQLDRLTLTASVRRSPSRSSLKGRRASLGGRGGLPSWGTSVSLFLSCGSLFVLLVICVTALGDAAETVSFQRDVQPILAEHCIQCHGPDEAAREADLRLDIREAAVDQALVPGNPGESQLLHRVTSTDPDTVMPPPALQNPLTPEQVETLRRWIADGAPYSGHWAFQPPQVNSEVPPADAIDALVRQRLQALGLKPSPRADLPTLCRRIYLDVVGLPPAPDEIDRFVAAANENLDSAVNALLDRLLASKHYGEKWARHWLDVARYADSNGYEKDMPRDQWAWRDWVIRSLNSDMPYDQFLVEQIAGDLLPDATQDQIVATGFLRNGMVNEEGAIVPEQFRMEGLFDRMDCIGKAVLGLSLQCAQCHSHKFDPISQDEYYGMFAFLNNTYEAQTWVYSAEQLADIENIRQGVAAIDEEIRARLPDWADRLASWERQQQEKLAIWQTVDPVDAVWIGGLNHPTELSDHSILVLGHPTASGEMYIVAEPELQGTTGLRFEALTYGDLRYGGPGRDRWGRFTLTELKVEVQPPNSSEWTKLEIAGSSADFSEPDHVLPGDEEKEADKQRRIGPVTYLVDDKETTAWRADRGPGRRNTPSAAVLQFAKPMDFPSGTQLKVSLINKHSEKNGGPAQLGRMRLALTSSPTPQAPPYDHAAALAVQMDPEQRTPAEISAIFAAWRQSVPELAEHNQRVTALQDQYPEAPTSVLSLAARDGEYLRETSLLDRGGWDRPKHAVEPHVPDILHPLDAPQPSRLDFARWLASEQSPLTARVQVNRVWQAIFGRGLVTTPEDFGTRAPQPEYLDVLDILAVEFVNAGWSTKQLIRAIITSDTYQQSSQASPELIARDPENVYLARGPRFRADAEVVRDLALAAAGLLHLEVGGPSIFPPVPQSVLDYNYTKPDYWTPPEGPERYRRALYVFRKRSMPDPTLTSFDAPNADAACARRVRSNTPLAGLVSLNEPIFVEAARGLALRVLTEGGDTDKQRVDYGYRLCTGRHSTESEQRELLSLLSASRQRLADGWLSINEVATGDPAERPELPPGATPQDAAAWTIAARVLLNLDETLCKN